MGLKEFFLKKKVLSSIILFIILITILILFSSPKPMIYSLGEDTQTECKGCLGIKYQNCPNATTLLLQHSICVNIYCYGIVYDCKEEGVGDPFPSKVARIEKIFYNDTSKTIEITIRSVGTKSISATSEISIYIDNINKTVDSWKDGDYIVEPGTTVTAILENESPCERVKIVSPGNFDLDTCTA